MENITFKETIEANDNHVLWVQFSCEDGSGASISLNNLASIEDDLTGQIMLKALKEHFQSQSEVNNDGT